MTQQYQLTPEGYKKLERELERLKTKVRKELAQKLAEEIAVGDLSENAQYQELKEQQAHLEDKIRELEEILRTAKVVKRKRGASVVGIGSKITVEIGGSTFTYELVGDIEADPMQGKISPSSPLGKAVMGKKKGDTFSFERPDGTLVEGKILKVE